MKKAKIQKLLITGGASGIGAAIARQAVGRGHQVLIADCNVRGGTAVADDIGEGASFIALDITSPDQWRMALDAAWTKFGALDVLINNAAIVHTGYARNVAIEAHTETMDVNALGPMRGMMAALPRFLEQGHGHLVTICSMTAFIPFPGLASYAAAKHALRAFHHGLALEERDSPIDFTIIHPTSTETPMLDKEAESDEVPMAFLQPSVTPDYVATVVLDAIEKKKLEVFMPPEAARQVRMLGTNPRRLAKIVAMAEAVGAKNLQERRAGLERSG